MEMKVPMRKAHDIVGHRTGVNVACGRVAPHKKDPPA
jgi:hypothetical protein